MLWCGCGAPKRATDADYTVDGCRICWVMGMRTMEGDDGAMIWAHEPPHRVPSEHMRQFWRLAGTDDTQATSTWLPDGAPTFRVGHSYDDDASLSLWLQVRAVRHFTRAEAVRLRARELRQRAVRLAVA